jgi:hypothetical protein
MIRKNLRKKNETEIKNTMEGHSSRLDKQKTEPQNLKMKWKLKEKLKSYLVKQLKTCERNIQELTNSIKTPNLRIIGIKEGEEVQAKGIRNIFNKIITENFPNLEKMIPIQVQEASRHQTDLTKMELPHNILLLKQQAQRIKKEY